METDENRVVAGPEMKGLSLRGLAWRTGRSREM